MSRKEILRTESPIIPEMYDRINLRLLHGAMGMVTEAGEFMDAIKKVVFYGKEPDILNMKEEIGDMIWYLELLMDTLDTDYETEKARVIRKLRVRYPDKFTEFDADNRSLLEETEALLDDEHEPSECTKHEWVGLPVSVTAPCGGRKCSICGYREIR